MAKAALVLLILIIDIIIFHLDYMQIPILSHIQSLQNSQEYESEQKMPLSCGSSTLADSAKTQISFYQSSSKQNPNSNISASSNYLNFKLHSSVANLNRNIEKTDPELHVDKKHLCAQHMKKSKFLCITCGSGVCQQCLSNPAMHRGHRFQRYNSRFEDLSSKCQQICAKIKFKKEVVSRNREITQNIINQQNQNRIERIKKLEQQVQKIKNNNKIQDGNNNSEQLKQLNEFYSICLAQLLNYSQVRLISHEGLCIEQKIQQNIKRVKQFSCELPKHNLVQSFEAPTPQIFYFGLPNFTKMYHENNQILLDPFTAFHNTWRVKVYPAGNMNKNVEDRNKGIQYLSIFVQRLDGTLKSVSFSIEIQLESKTNSKIIINKKFQSEYVKGESWGYDKYTRVSNIYEHGFLGKYDNLEIKVTINPVSFYEATKIVKEVEKQKENHKQQNLRKIQILKQKLKNKKTELTSQKSQIMYIEQSQRIEKSPVYVRQHSTKKLQRVKTFQRSTSQPFIEPQLLQPLDSIQTSRPKFTTSSIVKQYIKYQAKQRVGIMNTSRTRTQFHHPEICLQKKSPGKIRLVSFKNMQLIQSSRSKMKSLNSSARF